MALALHGPVHMSPATGACMTQDHGIFIHDLQLVAILQNAHFVGWRNCDNRENRTFWLPAFGAATGVIMRGLRGNLHDNGISGTVAGELAACKTFLARFSKALVDARVKRNRRSAAFCRLFLSWFLGLLRCFFCHVLFLPCWLNRPSLL